MESEILKRLEAIERRFDFFTEAYKVLHNHIIIKRPTDSYEVQVNAILKKLTEFLSHFCLEMKKVDSEYFFGTLKYMSKQIHEMEKSVKGLQEEGIKKKIHLDLTLDGYEMIRKTRKIPYQEEIEDPEKSISNLFSTLLKRESQVIAYRYGLLGNKEHSFVEIGKKIKVSGNRSRQIFLKAIRKCRHPSRSKLVDKITHLELRQEILGE